jgi:RNA polymerase sigma factor (sigma-70 family)
MSSPLETPVAELRALLDRCVEGDRDAWDEFVDRFHRRISLFVVRACESAGSAEIAGGDGGRDLVQEVYLKLLAEDRRALRAWRGESEVSFLAYLGKVVRSVAVDAVRRAHSQKRAVLTVPLESDEDESSSPMARLAASGRNAPDELLEERATTERLLGLLRASADVGNATRDVLVFQLFTFEGLTAREIAAVPSLSLTVANVEVIVHRTRMRLRRAVEAERGDVGSRADYPSSD